MEIHVIRLDLDLIFFKFNGQSGHQQMGGFLLIRAHRKRFVCREL